MTRAEERANEAEYDQPEWAADERDHLRVESVEALGWEGMEAYQDDDL